MDILLDAAVPEIVNTATSVPPSESSVPPSLPKPLSDSKKALKAGASKNKQMTSGIPRVTRGSLKKKEQQAEKAGQAPRSTLARKKALISVAQASPKKADLRKELSPLSDSEESGDAPVASTSTLRVPQTPAKLPSFAKPTQSSLAKTPAAPRSPVKPSFGSPTKLARSTTLATRPAKTYASQTEANSLLNEYYRKAGELNSSMMSHTPVVLRPPGVPRSAPALQRSVTHESVLCNKAGPSSARSSGASSTSQAGQQRSLADFIDVKSNDANPVGKRMMTGRGKPIFPNKATYKASQKTPLAAVPGSPVKGTSVVDLSEDASFESDNRARLLLLRAGRRMTN
ncbi:hypothetical protein BDZ89DRAFT_384027 [Hymenopellis radicata]|nr:hypothetical protein BDZ89DRAFT_384027 [Hymenopellis radicata]